MKRIARDKGSSLFGFFTSDGEKRFYSIDTICEIVTFTVINDAMKI